MICVDPKRSTLIFPFLVTRFRKKIQPKSNGNLEVLSEVTTLCLGRPECSMGQEEQLNSHESTCVKHSVTSPSLQFHLELGP